VFPARLFMGDAGALAFGAILVVVAVLSEAFYLLPIVCAIYMFEAISSALQWASRLILKRKIFLIAPFHHHLEALGWESSKVTSRMWLAGAVLSILGLAVYFLK
jgi:phospho-N-acetylmuramoyl-pentapeptide-transferase